LEEKMKNAKQILMRVAAVGFLTFAASVSWAAFATQQHVQPMSCGGSCAQLGGCGHGCACGTTTCGTPCNQCIAPGKAILFMGA
jgi:hypothetical protein